MPIFSKKKLEKIQNSNKDDLNYLFEKFSIALVQIEKKLDQIVYQATMFGSTPQILTKGKKRLRNSFGMATK